MKIVYIPVEAQEKLFGKKEDNPVVAVASETLCVYFQIKDQVAPVSEIVSFINGAIAEFEKELSKKQQV